jgi:hypothetical protein
MSDRIFYAVQAVGIAQDDGASISWLHGVQSVGITTNFNLEQVFELGQLALYQNVENVPEIEVTTERVLDGWPSTYGTACTAAAVQSDIVSASVKKAGVYLIIYPDTNTAATGLVGTSSLVYCSGMRPSNVTYTFPVEGNATESVTFVGNAKQWASAATLPASNTPAIFKGITDANPDAPTGNTVIRRQHFVSGSPSVLPLEVTNAGQKIQTITVTADIGRENIFQLGQFRPYVKYANFPVAITCDFEVISLNGDGISTSGENPSLGNREIQLKFDTTTGNSLLINLGTKNKLTSVNYTGGDTGGGNATMTFSYQGFNAFAVTHSADV